MNNYVQEYIQDIESGRILVCESIRQLYIGIIKPIIEDRDPTYYFDVKAGSKFIRFTEEFCKQSKGEWNGKPLSLLLFQKAKYQIIFGIKERETGLRRFREVFDLRGRKNGKSTENSSLGLYLEVEEPGAEVYVAATIRQQALRVWEESRSMISKSKELKAFYTSKIFPQAEIAVKDFDSTYKVLSRDVKTQDGLNASCAIIDEVHELARATYDILKQATSSREQPLVSMITTAGFRRGALFDDLYEYSKKVLDGTISDPRWLPILYELDSSDEMFDEKMWIKANPGLGVIKKLEALRDNVNKIKGDPNFANTVKIKDFNIIGVGATTWLDGDVIANEEQYTDEELEQFRNSTVLGGYDLSRTNDLTAFSTLLFDQKKAKIIVITMYWCTSDFLDSPEAAESKVPWKAWIDRGLIRISGEHLIDYHDVANYVISNFQKWGWTYDKINYDSYSAGYLVDELESMGFSKDRCQVATPQGYKTLSIPMQEMEALLKAKKLVYQNNPVTKWMLSNIEPEQDRNGNLMPKKMGEKRGNKIDGPATILNALVSYCQSKQSYLNSEEGSK